MSYRTRYVSNSAAAKGLKLMMREFHTLYVSNKSSREIAFTCDCCPMRARPPSFESMFRETWKSVIHAWCHRSALALSRARAMYIVQLLDSLNLCNLSTTSTLLPLSLRFPLPRGSRRLETSLNSFYPSAFTPTVFHGNPRATEFPGKEASNRERERESTKFFTVPLSRLYHDIYIYI